MSLAKLARERGLPALVRDLPGTRVRLVREAETGMMTIPAGAVLTVSSAATWSKVFLKGDPCACCGIRPHVRMSVDGFEAAPPEPPPAPRGIGGFPGQVT